MKRLAAAVFVLVSAWCVAEFGCSPGLPRGEVVLSEPGALWANEGEAEGRSMTGPELVDACYSLPPGPDRGSKFLEIRRNSSTFVADGSVVRVESWLTTPGGRDVARVTVVQGKGLLSAAAGDTGFMTPDDLR